MTTGNLQGRARRGADIATLILACAPLTVGEIIAGIEGRGRRIVARYPRQAVADALGYEHERGRAVRVRRGSYRACRLPKTTRWRIVSRYGQAAPSCPAQERLDEPGHSGGTGGRLRGGGGAPPPGVFLLPELEGGGGG